MATNGQSSTSAVKAGGAFVELSIIDEKLQRGLQAAQNRLKRFSADVGAMGASLAKIGGGIVAPLGVATNQYADFSDKMLVVRARTKASDEEFTAMKNRVQELTRTTSFSATQIAEGMINLASMGMNPQQINAMIESLLNLSRATGEELGNAVNIALNNMNIFKADISEVEGFVDVLSKTANGSAQILGDLGEALKMSANSAKTANIDFVSLNAILAVLANNGQRGTMAGTGLRNVFLSFTKNAEQFKQYGINFKDASGELLSIPEIFDQIAQKVKTMPTLDRQNMFYQLFDIRGLNAASILTENVDELRNFTNELKAAQGDGKKTAQLMDSEIGGALRKVGNAFKGVSAEIGKAIAEYLTPMLRNMATAIHTITDWVKRNHELVVSIAKIGAVFVTAGVALIAFSKVFAIASAAVTGLKVAVHAVMLTLMMLTNPLYAAIALAGVFAFSMQDAADGFKNGFSTAFEDVKNGYESLKFAILNGKLEDAFAIIVLSIKQIWHDLFDEIISYWKAIESFFAKGFAWIYSKFDSDLNFDDMSKTIDDMVANDVTSFKTARQKYQQQINDIVQGIQTAKNERTTQDNNAKGGVLGVNNDLLESLKKLPAVEMDMQTKVNDPTFGAFSLDAINYGQPTYEINKQMLQSLKNIEQNTRQEDDDDEGLTLY